jgi:hypothetical protein
MHVLPAGLPIGIVYCSSFGFSRVTRLGGVSTNRYTLFGAARGESGS